MQVVVLSPHRDDAAFSCGLLLSNLARAMTPVTIVNVCTVSAYAPYLAAGSLERTAQVTARRQAEDLNFVGLLTQHGDGCAVTLVDLGWSDVPLRWRVRDEVALEALPTRPDEVEALSVVLQKWHDAEIVLAPAALGGHLDHRLVHQAARETFPLSSLVFYDDLPYACRATAAELHRASTLQDHAARQVWLPCDGQEPGLKRAFVLCYPSQVAPEVADEMELYATQHGGRECYTGQEEALVKLRALLREREAAA